jgi:hypothetical protein
MAKEKQLSPWWALEGTALCPIVRRGDSGRRRSRKVGGGVDFLEMNRQCLWTMESTAAMTDLALSSRALAPSRLLAG